MARGGEMPKPLRYGLMAAGSAVVLIYLANSGPEGESKNEYAELLAARTDSVAAGRPFNAEGIEVDKTRPVSRETVQFAMRVMLREGDENPKEPSAQGKATMACSLAAANNIPVAEQTRNVWSAARSDDRLDEANAEERADELYAKAADLCMAPLLNAAGSGKLAELAIPIAQAD